MDRSVLMACLPWMAILLASFGVLFIIARANRARFRPKRLLRLHVDQRGAVQSLGFVITLPIFIMVMMLIVQVSQLMIGQIAVEYAAFAAARSAAVWIPADTLPPEGSNCISSYYDDPDAVDQVYPSFDGPTDGGMTYLIVPGSAKYEKITSAAVMACMSISPSRDVGASLFGTGPEAVDILYRTYTAMAPGSDSAAALAGRIRNKLAYSMANTSVEIRFYHRNSEPPLTLYPQELQGGESDSLRWEFQSNELGWQDQITVTVKHNLAMLPGPGRLLARSSEGVNDQGTVYVYPLTASATIGNEGEKSVIPYVYQTY